MKFPFRSLGKDLIGFLDKKVHFRGICRIFYRDYSLPSLLFFEKKKKRKKRKTVASTKYRFVENGIGNDRLSNFSVLFLEDGGLNIEYLSSYEVVSVFVKK